jgi:putative holliday junction resolvase
MRILSIDFGSKNVGIAIGDSEHGLGFPKAVLKNDKMILMSVKKLVLEEKVEKIVIGESKNYKGEDNKVMGAINEFKTLLEKETGIPVVFQPEFMTSAEAEHLQGKNDMLDASAAAIILKSYFDKHFPKS